MPKTKAKKSLGQHFLVNKRYAFEIVRALDPNPGETVIEIGPGRGALTGLFLESGCRVMAIELDKTLAQSLRNSYGNKHDLEVINQDFLFLSNKIIPAKAKLVGNIPYNLTSEIFDKLFEIRDRLNLAVLTIQLEVARKISARFGENYYGREAILLWAGFEIAPLFTIPRRAFSPAPRVTSKVIRLIPVDRGLDNIDAFRDFVRSCFRQKARTLVNSMRLGLNLPKEECERLLVDSKIESDPRPSGVSFEYYKKLYRQWKESV